MSEDEYEHPEIPKREIIDRVAEILSENKDSSYSVKDLTDVMKDGYEDKVGEWAALGGHIRKALRNLSLMHYVELSDENEGGEFIDQIKWIANENISGYLHRDDKE